MNKYVVYTALFGDYDDLIEPKTLIINVILYVLLIRKT